MQVSLLLFRYLSELWGDILDSYWKNPLESASLTSGGLNGMFVADL